MSGISLPDDLDDGCFGSAVHLAHKVIVLFLLIGVGTLAVKTGVLKLEHKQPLSNLLVNIVVPAMIVNSYQMEFSLEILRNLLARSDLGAQPVTLFAEPLPDRSVLLVFHDAGVQALPDTLDETDELSVTESRSDLLEEQLRETRQQR